MPTRQAYANQNPNSTAPPASPTKASSMGDGKYEDSSSVVIFLAFALSLIGDDGGSILSHVEMGRLRHGLLDKNAGCYTAFHTVAISMDCGRNAMYKSVDKVVSEFVFSFPAFEFRVRARISEKLGAGLNTPLPFSWTVSHYYKLKDAPSATLPQKTECASREEAERLLFTYMRSFTDVVEPNKFY